MEKLQSSPATWSSIRPLQSTTSIHRPVSIYAVLLSENVQQLEQREIQGDQKLFKVVLH